MCQSLCKAGGNSNEYRQYSGSHGAYILVSGGLQGGRQQTSRQINDEENTFDTQGSLPTHIHYFFFLSERKDICVFKLQ